MVHAWPFEDLFLVRKIVYGVVKTHSEPQTDTQQHTEEHPPRTEHGISQEAKDRLGAASLYCQEQMSCPKGVEGVSYIRVKHRGGNCVLQLLNMEVF